MGKEIRHWALRHGRAALVGLLACVAATACGHPGRPAAPPQTGVLDGMHFTVVSGSVQQSHPDQPITVGRQETLIVFDPELADIAPNPKNLRITAMANFDEGGRVVVGAFGAKHTLAGAYRIGVRRHGTSFTYSFGPLQGSQPTRTGTFTSTPRHPDATLYFRTEVRTRPTISLRAWTPWNSIPADCAVSSVGAAGAPPSDPDDLGRHVGVWLQNVTLRGLSLLYPSYQGCPSQTAAHHGVTHGQGA